MSNRNKNRTLAMGFTEVAPRKDDNTNEGTNLPSDELTNQPTNEPTHEQPRDKPARLSHESTKNETRKRFSFDLKPSIHKALKAECVRSELNMYETVENLIMEWVNDKRHERGQ